MEAIFLSYRRSDSEGQAGRLFENLVAKFGRGAVLLDVAGLEKGRDFRKTIDSRLTTCKVMLALIGRSWADAKDDTGAKRLDNPNDLVRIEIAAALRRDIPVIPVLVGGATMPRAGDLPDDLKDLVFRDGVEITHARWDSDVQLLIEALEPHLAPAPTPPVAAPPPHPPPAPRRARLPTGLLLTGVALALGAGGWGVQHWQAERRARDAAVAAEQAELQAAQQRAAAEKAVTDHAAADKAAAEKALTERAAVERAAAEKAAADKAAAETAAAEKAAAEKKAAEKAAAEKKAAEKAAADKAVADRAAKDKALADRAAADKAAVRPPPAAESVTRLQRIAAAGTGADFGVAYQAADHGPLRTSVRVCVSHNGPQGRFSYCGIRPAVVGAGKAVVQLHYPEHAAAALNGPGKGMVEACLVTYKDNFKDHAVVDGSCTAQPW